MKNIELTQIRESLGLTKSELAKMLGTSAMLIGRMEKGSCQITEAFEEMIKKMTAAPAEEEPAAEEKPKRKGGRKKKAEAAPVEEAPAVAEEAAPVEEPVAEEAAPAEEPAPVVAEEPAPAVEEKAKRKGGKKKAAPSVTIQSAMGGSISVEEILEKIPAADEVYIKVEENKAYWVKGEDSGFVLLWD